MLANERETNIIINIIKNIYNKRLNKINKLSKAIDYGDLKFIVSSSGVKTNFSEIRDTVAFLDDIRKCEILIQEARYKQEEFSRYLKKNNWK